MHGRNWQRNLDRKGGQAIATLLVLAVLLVGNWLARKLVPVKPIPVAVTQERER